MLLLLFLHQQKLFKVVFKPISRESWTLQERFLRYAKILWQKLFSILDQFQIWFSKKIPSKSSHPYHEYSLSWAIPITSIPYHEPSLSWVFPIMNDPYHEYSLSWVFPIMSHPYHEYLPVNFFPCILIVLVNKSGFRDTLKFRWQKLYKWETLAHAVIPLLNQIKICTLWCE